MSTVSDTETLNVKPSHEVVPDKVDADPEKTDEKVDENAVWWDGEDDPNNPMNWSMKKKTAAVFVVSAIAFSTPFSADVSAPAIPSIMSDFHDPSEVLAGFVVSIYNLGNAIGPIVLAPASEVWGRNLIFNISNITFVGFTIGCALSTSLPMLLVFRFLAGCAGAAPLSVGGGTIADLIPQEKRGKYFAIFAIGPQIAPILGPIVGAFLSEKPGWRWTFWIVVIIHAVITILTPFCLRETYAPAILRRKVLKLRKETGNDKLHVKNVAEQPTHTVFKKAIVRPAKIFFLSPVVLFLSTFQAVVYGYRYVMYTTIPLVFTQQYHFSTGVSGLAYLGNGIGASIALYAVTKTCDYMITSFKKKHPDETPAPERRLLPMVWAAPLCPIGLVWYGWSAQERVQWMCPIMGTVVFGAGIVAASLPSNLYMIDAFTQYAASGLAASFFLRSVVGGFLPMAGYPLYVHLGVGWGCTVLALIALVMCAFPPLIYKYGTYLRLRFPVKNL